MQKRLAGLLMSAALAACGPRHASFVKVDDVALGRVVIYRNGVAFYERRATVEGGTLTVTVPRERVDDFLKSLTVVDAISKKPLPVSIPRQQMGDGPNLVMHLQLPSEKTAEVVLTYVTESPAWKPSYRAVVGDHHDVMLEGWAIVDNTSGEDWKNVLVGVGSSSALSFRYDLWSVRQIQREQLADDEQFAVAPPTGVSPYVEGGPAGGEEVLADVGNVEPTPSLSDEELSKLAENEAQGEVITVTGSAIQRRELTTAAPVSVLDRSELESVAHGRVERSRADRPVHPAKMERPAAPPPPPDPLKLSDAVVRSNKTIVVESYAATESSRAHAAERATQVRNKLVDQGVAASRIKLVTKIEPAQGDRVRLVAQAPGAASERKPARAAAAADAEPVGESHFASALPMTVERGSSAMVSMVRSPTEGEVVYLYDAESERGNARFAFRAVRFKNPTDSTLESGPVTVYGNERFIGEGLTEPVAPHASAVVPYALDRQIVIERTDGEDDQLSKLTSLQRGVLTAEVQHIRRQHLKVTNRLNQVAKVFVRHTVHKGWALTDAPTAFERVGEAHLFEVQLAPHESKDVVIAEATPIEKRMNLGADPTLAMMRVWLESPDGAPELKEQMRKVLQLHKGLVDLMEEQGSQRRRLTDFKARMDDLHRQIVSLQLVKTGGDLLAHLRTKMKEISDRVQKTTIEIVDKEEKIMLARVRFQDALGELALPDALPKNARAAR